MKQVGKHQNVLSFLGCWTTNKPFLLIIEYVAHGDLLHWLRSKRIQVVFFNNNHETIAASFFICSVILSVPVRSDKVYMCGIQNICIVSVVN